MAVDADGLRYGQVRDVGHNKMFNPEFLTTDSSDGHAGNSLIQYLQEQSPDTLQRVAKSASNDIQDIIRHNVQGLLGMLPGEHFEVKVTANRDNLANMLASAMMTGYFLRQMEQRKEAGRDPVR